MKGGEGVPVKFWLGIHPCPNPHTSCKHVGRAADPIALSSSLLRITRKVQQRMSVFKQNQSQYIGIMFLTV